MKKKQIQGLGLVEAVSLALVVVLIGAVCYVVFLSDEAFKSSPQEVEAQPPMPAIPPYSDVQTLTEEEKSEAIELAINDPEVKKWLDEGYEIYEVVTFPLPLPPPQSTYEDIRPCLVYILTKKQKLPWVLGITIKVSVDVIQEKVHGFDFNLKLAPLTEDQKEEAVKIALADPEVLKIISDEEYEIQSVGMGYWKSCKEGECSFHAYPCVNIIVNPDARYFPEVITKADIYVDLESKEVVKINSIPKQVPPPPPGKENTYEIPLISSFKQINLYENGEIKSLNELEGIAGVLVSTLSTLDLQAACVYSEEDIQKIKSNDKVIEAIFVKPRDITISQFVEQEERYHIPCDENGYRILKNVKTALFILEDNLDEGLRAHVLIGSERKEREERCSWEITKEDMEKLGPCEAVIGYKWDERYGCVAVSGCKYISEIVPYKTKEECEMACGRIMWSCWAIKQEGSNEIDKAWVEKINSGVIEFQKPKPIISVNSTVFEGERWMSILSDGKVTCYSDHYYPDHKEIVIKEGHISREEIDVLLELFSNLSEYSDYTVNVSEQLIRDHMDCIFDPVGGGTKISCIPLNKTLKLRVRPPSFPEPETATITAKEIMERIDRIYREAEVSERIKEINPYLISLNPEPYAPSYQPNQMITFNASSKDGWLGNVSSYEWDFGDGSKGYGETVRHAYTAEGNYTVKLTVITSDGAVGVKCKTINVARSALTPALASEVPGFEAVFTFAVLLAVAYLRRRK